MYHLLLRLKDFKTLDIDLNPDNSNSDDQYQNIEALLPYANAYFDQQIDHDKILKEIRSEVIEDSIVNKIFEGYCLHGLKRREILIVMN